MNYFDPNRKNLNLLIEVEVRNGIACHDKIH